MSFYENLFILKWIGILGWRDKMLILYGYDPQVLVRIIWSIQIVLKIDSFILSKLMSEFYAMEDILKAKAKINMI